MLTRMLARAAFAAGLLCAGVHCITLAHEIKVTLLGTGCPPASMERFGPSILVEVGGKKFLFDTGRGAIQRLEQLKINWQDIDGVFFTHLHSDHVVGFPDLWLTGWLIAPGRNKPLPVWGPIGTSAIGLPVQIASETMEMLSAVT